MRTNDLFKIDRSAKKINESIEKVFGKKLNLESFDLDQLQDARNKIRTQLSQQRGSSGFNENIENEAYTKAQWMLDAINAEISHREEFIVDDIEPGVAEATGDVKFDKMLKGITGKRAVAKQQKADSRQQARDAFGSMFGGSNPASNLSIRKKGVSEVDIPKTKGPDESDPWRQGWVAWFERNGNNPYEKGTPEHSKWEDGFDDAGLQPDFYESKDRYKEEFEVKSTNKGNDMTRLRESEIDQASAIVTANTMVDRLGRWIEELSGMENETLLQLGDSIRDEMGQEQSRQFIEAVAPTMQSALETLKSARESVSGAVRLLATGESPDAMLGAPDDTGMDSEMDMSDPDAMNAGELDMEPEMPADDFDAAEPAAGGIEAAGRAKRESIDFQNRLLKVLAG